MISPRVSVVLPVFNAGATLDAAIESIRSQTFPDWELLLVNDGSTDHSITILQQTASADSRIRLINLPHSGIVGALNAGLVRARGKYVARMDADDVSHAERLEHQVALLDRHPEVGLASCLVDFGGIRSEAGGYALHVDWMNSLVSYPEILLNQFVESPFAHPSVIFRRALTGHFGGYREGGFPEDYELWLRWLAHGVIMQKIPLPLLTWNDPPGRLSRNSSRYDLEAFYQCKAPYLAAWLQKHVAPSRKILIWGAGRPTRKRAEWLNSHGITISGYIDIDIKKQGRIYGNRPVISPESIPAAQDAFVIGYVAKRGAHELIRSFMRTRGFIEGSDFILAA